MQKDKLIQVRLTKDEWLEVRYQANKLNMSISDYLRHLLFPPEIEKEDSW